MSECVRAHMPVRTAVLPFCLASVFAGEWTEGKQEGLCSVLFRSQDQNSMDIGKKMVHDMQTFAQH